MRKFQLRRVLSLLMCCGTAILCLAQNGSTKITTSILASTGTDNANEVIADGLGHIYVVGTAGNATQFGQHTSVYGTTGSKDAFVAKFDAALGTLLKTTILASTLDDDGLGIALSADKQTVYVCGTTRDPNSFAGSPTVHGSPGLEDGFIVKLNSDLDQLQASVVLASTEKDEGQEVAVGYDGSVFFVGQAGNDHSFACGNCPEKVKFGDSNGNVEAFVSKFSADLSTHIRSTLLTSDAEDEAYAVDFDANNSVFICGRTKNYDDFPCSKEYYGGQPILKVGYSAFVSKLDYQLNCIKTGILASDIVSDVARDVAIDAQGNVFVAGLTEAPGSFPKSPKYTHGNSGLQDGFIVKLNNSLNNHSATALLASSDKDKIFSLHIADNGDVYTAGYTFEPNDFGNNDTLVGHRGAEEAIVMKLNNQLNTNSKTYILGSDALDICYGLWVDPVGNVYVVGETEDYIDLAVNRTLIGTPGGSNEAFVMKISEQNCPAIGSTQSVNITDRSVRLQWQNTGTFDHFRIRGGLSGSNNPVEISVPGNVSQKLINGLQASTAYQWQIAGYCDENELIDASWSTLSTFTTSCAAIAQTTVSQVTTSGAVLGWSATAGSFGYRLEGRVAGSQQWSRFHFNVGTTSVQPNNLLSGTTYEWRVKNQCDVSGNLYSPPSPINLFTTQSAKRGEPRLEAKNNSLKVYPNPSNDGKFNLELHDLNTPIDRILVFDGTGFLIKTIIPAQLPSELFSIDLSKLRHGVYVVQIHSADKFESFKLIFMN